MRAALYLLAASAIAVAGCKRVDQAVGHLAENTRTATERMAIASEQSDERRELRNDPYVGDFRKPPALKLTERFETREGPDGYFVYDTEAHSIAHIGSQAQSGLTFDQARAALDALSTAAERHPR